MLPVHKEKALAALKRLDGLSAKLHTMIENEEYCPDIMEMALSMKGHIEHVQSQVLQSHLQTCAVKKLSSTKNRESFVQELVRVIGLSKR